MHQRPRHPDGKVHGVVVGVQREDGRWLLIRRSASVVAPRAVCFPGGGIEPVQPPAEPEHPALAAAREFQEEVGGKIEPLQQVWLWDSPNRPLLLYGWLGRLLTPADNLQANPHEVEELLWLTAEEASTHPDRLYGTEFFVQALCQAVQINFPKNLKNTPIRPNIN